MPAIVVGPEVNTACVTWWNQFLPSRIVQSPAGDRVNVTDPATWSSWLGTGGYNAVTFDLGASPVALSSVGIAAHNLASKAVPYSIVYSNDNENWTRIRPSDTPLTDEDIHIIFPRTTARYWRVQMEGAGASIGVVIGGPTLMFPHAPLDGYTPLHHARKYTKLFNDSIKGQFLNNRVLSAGAENEVDMGFLPRPWVENNIRGFEKHFNTGGTFFYSGCPSKYPLDTGYCRAASAEDVVEIEWIEAEKMANVSWRQQSYVG